MKTDGIIFDLDGTLWDSCRAVTASWSITLREKFGAGELPDTEDIKAAMGKTPSELAQAFFSGYGDRAMEVCLECMEDEINYIAEHGADIYPGVEQMLDRLSAHYPLFIVSNCGSGYIECFLEYSGFGKYIKDHECVGSTGLVKAENIALICRRYGLENAVYLGDTAGDEKSARKAGCRFVHAAYGFGKAEAPDAELNSALDFAALIESMDREM